MGMKKRIRAIQGGTSASKTVSIIILLIALAQTDEVPTLTSIVSESFPHLKRGAIRDFQAIMQQHHYWNDDRWNKTDCIYTFETGSKIEFFSADLPGRVRGPRRDRLFINEANNVDFESFDQLEVRTKEFVFIDWNPTNEFWFYTEVLGQRDDVEHIILTYKDNEALDPQIVTSIEKRKTKKSWWRVYGLGQLGETEARIYTGWKIVDDVPFEAKLLGYGLDFGYTNDPTAIVAVYQHDGGYILDEVAYSPGLSNRQIGDIFDALERGTIIADSSEPKSIAELKSYHLVVLPCQKGSGSVSQGIAYVKDEKISVTKKSTNILKEYRNYLWVTDDDGKITNEPEDGLDHLMDAIRYRLAYSFHPQEARQSQPSNAAAYRRHSPQPSKMVS